MRRILANKGCKNNKRTTLVILCIDHYGTASTLSVTKLLLVNSLIKFRDPVFDSPLSQAVGLVCLQKLKSPRNNLEDFNLVRRKRIELLSPAWKAGILPLNQHRLCCHYSIFGRIILTLSECRDSNPESLVPKTRMLAVTPHSDVNCPYILTYF